MTIAKIFTNDKYYHIEKKKDSYQILCITDNNSYYLTKNQINILFDDIFGGEKQYLENKDGYDIYLDKTGNKRFFKNNQEDFQKLILENSTQAVVYQNTSVNDNNSESRNIEFKSKKTPMRSYILLTCEVVAIVAEVLYGTQMNVKHNTNNIEEINDLETVQQEESIDPITLNEMLKKINDSPYLTEKQKKYLSNKNFLEDVLYYADSKYKKELNSIYSDYIQIRYFTEKEKKERPNSAGFVNSAHPNIIHLYDESDEIFYYAGPHEFAHTNQYHPHIYKYIDEPSAEIIKAEYFNEEDKSYEEARVNLALLMEIIGPEPVIKLNFKGDFEPFENIIKSHLSEEDANTLLNEYKKHAKEKIEIIDGVEYKYEPADHEKVRELLIKLYKNMNPGKSIEDDAEIEYILNKKEIPIGRYYFNQHLYDFYKSNDISIPLEIPYTDNLEVKTVIYYQNTAIETEQLTDILSKDKLDENETIHIIYTENGNDFEKELGLRNNSINKIVENNMTLKDLINNNLITIKRCILTTKHEEEVKNKSIKELSKELFSINISYYNVILKDGETINVSTYKMNDKNEYGLYLQKNLNIHIRPISEKFPDQVRPLSTMRNRILSLRKANEELESIDRPYLFIEENYQVMKKKEQNNYVYKETANIKYLCILMEIIGPKPIQDYILYKDNAIIENLLYEYLDKEDAEKLSSELKKKSEETNPKVLYKLIKKLYENKYPGKQIEDNTNIKAIIEFGVLPPETHSYFTPNLSSYNEFQNIDYSESNTWEVGEMPYYLHNAIVYNYNPITIEELKELLETSNSKEDYIEIIYKKKDDSDNNTHQFINSIEYFNYIDLLQKINNGEITVLKCSRIEKKELNNNEFTEHILSNKDKKIVITINCSDGITLTGIKKANEDTMTLTKEVKGVITPISELFPEQCEQMLLHY